MGLRLRNLCIIFVTSFALVFSTFSVAMDDEDSDSSPFAFDFGRTLATTGILGGIAAFLAYMLSGNGGSGGSSEQPLEPEKPTIAIDYKQSTLAVYAFPGETHLDGKVVIKNSTSETVQLTMEIPESALAAVEILDNSSCHGALKAGESCSYNFSYAAKNVTAAASMAATTLPLKIRGENYEQDFNLQVFLPGHNYFLSLPQNTTGFDRLPSDMVNAVFARHGKVYAATAAGVSVSHDQGSSWVTYTMAQGLGSNKILSIFVDEKGIIYAGTDGKGLAISKNNGLTWKMYQIAGMDKVQCICVRENQVYIGTVKGLLYVGNMNLDNITWQVHEKSGDELIQYVNSVYINDGSDTIYVGTDDGLAIGNIVSGDIYWWGLQATSPMKLISSIHGNGKTICVGSASGLHVSEDNINWIDQNWDVTVHSVYIDAAGGIYVILLRFIGHSPLKLKQHIEPQQELCSQ